MTNKGFAVTLLEQWRDRTKVLFHLQQKDIYKHSWLASRRWLDKMRPIFRRWIDKTNNLSKLFAKKSEHHLRSSIMIIKTTMKLRGVTASLHWTVTSRGVSGDPQRITKLKEVEGLPHGTMKAIEVVNDPHTTGKGKRAKVAPLTPAGLLRWQDLYDRG